MNVIIYTDGSSRPNPGKAGWGAHGYSYVTTTDKQKKQENAILTNKGYILSTEHKDEVFVDPIDFFDFCVFEYDCDTNNSAELYAVYRVLDYFQNYDIKSLTIFTDSEYVRRGLSEYLQTWISNDWKRQDGQPIMRVNIWKKIVTLKERYESLKIDFKIEWIKGHSTNYGNYVADNLASIAANKGYYTDEFKSYKVTPSNDYNKIEIDRHPLLCFKREYFSDEKNTNNIGRYFIAQPSDNIEYLIGKRSSEASYSVIQFKEPIPIIEIIKNRQRSISNNCNKIIALKLDRVFDKSIYSYLKEYGADCLIFNSDKNNNLNFIDGRNVTNEMNPPGLITNALNYFLWLECILVDYISGKLSDKVYQTIDVTDFFFTKQKKKIILKQDFQIGKKDYRIPINVTLNNLNKQLDVPLVLGLDILPRNNLKNIENKSPTITLVLFSETHLVYRYSFIIEVDDAIGIFSNFHSDKLLIPLI